jgi:hypothetical protein
MAYAAGYPCDAAPRLRTARARYLKLKVKSKKEKDDGEERNLKSEFRVQNAKLKRKIEDRKKGVRDGCFVSEE